MIGNSGTAPPGGADPTHAPAAGQPDAVTPGIPGSVTPGAPGAVTPGIPGSVTPGIPGGVTPGIAGAPVPGIAAPSAAGVPEAPTPGIPAAPAPAPAGSPQPNAGPQVTITGSVRFATYKKGKVRITVFDGDHSLPSITPPRVLGMAEIAQPGAFSLTVPQNAGKVYIEGSIDEDEDGRPGPQEPCGKADRYPLTVTTAAVSGVDVELQRVEPPPGGTEKKDDF